MTSSGWRWPSAISITESPTRYADALPPRKAKPRSLSSPKKLAWLMVREPESLNKIEERALSRLLQESQVNTTYLVSPAVRAHGA